MSGNDVSGRVLVVFYSHSGHTRTVSRAIAKALGADTLEIEPVKEVTKGPMKFMWGGMQATMSHDPELRPFEQDPGAYSTLFIGTPVWAWTVSPPVAAFLRHHLPGNRKVALYCLADGNNGKTMSRMSELCEGSQIMGKLELTGKFEKRHKAMVREAVEWARSIAPEPGIRTKVQMRERMKGGG